MTHATTRSLSFKSFEINAAWTSIEPRQGWVHFRIAGRRRESGELQLEMMAVCDRAVRFWVAHQELRDPKSWLRGWIRPEDATT